jgi:hypothetical protein
MAEEAVGMAEVAGMVVAGTAMVGIVGAGAGVVVAGVAAGVVASS